MATTDEIMGYVLNSPHNTNPNVLRDMLNEQSGGGASVYEVELDIENSTLTAKVSAEELFDATRSGCVILHGLVTMSDTAYQETTMSIMTSSLAVSGANIMYSFDVLNGDTSVAFIANSSDAFPTAILRD